MGVKEEGWQKGFGKIFEKIMGKKFPNLMYNINLSSPRSSKNPKCGKHKEISILIHEIKLLKVKDWEDLESEKGQMTQNVHGHNNITKD
jgi:hypothetical protein